MVPGEQVEAQSCSENPYSCKKKRLKPTEVLRKKKLPEQLQQSSAYILVRMAKLSETKRGKKLSGGLGGLLIGTTKAVDSGEKVALKKATWSTLQIAPFHKENNDFLGKGKAKKNKRKRGESKAFFLNPKHHFHEDDHYRSYLIKVTPGHYVIGGTETTCFCWGSKQFTLAPGVVSNLGTIYIAHEDGTSAWPDLATIALSDDLLSRGYTTTDVMKIDRPSAVPPVYEAIASLEIVPVRYEDAKDFGNHFGRMPNKMLPDGWTPETKLTLD